jgi:hypothetical protein
MRSTNLYLRKETVAKLKAESKRRDPDSKRQRIGYIIDELVEQHLPDPPRKAK